MLEYKIHKFLSCSGFLLQYFENARLELAPDAQGELGVRLTDLGVLLGGWDLPLVVERFPIGNNPGCRYYAESGHPNYRCPPKQSKKPESGNSPEPYHCGHRGKWVGKVISCL